MEHQDQPEIIYKYASQVAARLILQNSTLRVGRPTEMNDPFDGYIDDLFNERLQDMHNSGAARLIDLLGRDPAEFASRIGVPLNEAVETSRAMNAGTDAQRQQMLNLLASESIAEIYPALEQERADLEIRRSEIFSQFQNSGIFCATRRYDNLLMWAHYAENHHGVAFGFRPDPAQDSFLCLLEPVIYSDVRPSFYEPFDPLFGTAPTPESMLAFTKSLTATKSTDWAYEEELRLVIPSYVPKDQPAVFIPFYPDELTELYLGHRTSIEFRDEICRAARALNKDVAIFQARLARNAFALTFDAVT